MAIFVAVVVVVVAVVVASVRILLAKIVVVVVVVSSARIRRRWYCYSPCSRLSPRTKTDSTLPSLYSYSARFACTPTCPWSTFPARTPNSLYARVRSSAPLPRPKRRRYTTPSCRHFLHHFAVVVVALSFLDSPRWTPRTPSSRSAKLSALDRLHSSQSK